MNDASYIISSAGPCVIHLNWWSLFVCTLFSVASAKTAPSDAPAHIAPVPPHCLLKSLAISNSNANPIHTIPSDFNNSFFSWAPLELNRPSLAAATPTLYPITLPCRAIMASIYNPIISSLRRAPRDAATTTTSSVVVVAASWTHIHPFSQPLCSSCRPPWCLRCTTRQPWRRRRTPPPILPPPFRRPRAPTSLSTHLPSSRCHRLASFRLRCFSIATSSCVSSRILYPPPRPSTPPNKNTTKSSAFYLLTPPTPPPSPNSPPSLRIPSCATISARTPSPCVAFGPPPVTTTRLRLLPIRRCSCGRARRAGAKALAIACGVSCRRCLLPCWVAVFSWLTGLTNRSLWCMPLRLVRLIGECRCTCVLTCTAVAVTAVITVRVKCVHPLPGVDWMIMSIRCSNGRFVRGRTSAWTRRHHRRQRRKWKEGVTKEKEKNKGTSSVRASTSVTLHACYRQSTHTSCCLRTEHILPVCTACHNGIHASPTRSVPPTPTPNTNNAMSARRR